MLAERSMNDSLVGEKDLRKQLDRSVSRALVDRDYAKLLLDDPTVALEDHGCPPQQFRSLRSIRATDLVDFARQAQDLFWRVGPATVCRDDQRSLAAAAAR